MVDARRITKGYATYDEFFRNEIETKSALVDRRITTLRERLFHNTTEAETSYMTYEEWVALDSERKMVALETANERDWRRQAARDNRQQQTPPPFSASESASASIADMDPALPTHPAEWTGWIEHIFEAPSGPDRAVRIMEKMRAIPTEAQRGQFRELLEQEKVMREEVARLAADNPPPLEPEGWMKDL